MIVSNYFDKIYNTCRRFNLKTMLPLVIICARVEMCEQMTIGSKTREGYVLFLPVTIVMFICCWLGAVPDFTCFNSRLYAYAVDQLFHFIGGFKSGDETDAVVSFERVLDTGSGSNLPTGGYEEVHPDLSVSAIRYIMYNSIGADIFGAYTCIFTSSQDQVKITTVILLENGKGSMFSGLCFFHQIGVGSNSRVWNYRCPYWYNNWPLQMQSCVAFSRKGVLFWILVDSHIKQTITSCWGNFLPTCMYC